MSRSGPHGAWFVIPAVLTVASIVALALLLPGIRPFGWMRDTQRYSMPGTHLVRLEEPGTYAVYVPPGLDSEVEVHVRSEDGAAVPLYVPDMPAVLTVNGTPLRSLREFRVDAPGRYRLVAVYPGEEGPRFRAAVGPAMRLQTFFGSFARIWLCAAIGFVGLGGSLILTIVLLILRSQRRKILPTPPPA
jgi:hypothetical protein